MSSEELRQSSIVGRQIHSVWIGKTRTYQVNPIDILIENFQEYARITKEHTTQHWYLWFWDLRYLPHSAFQGAQASNLTSQILSLRHAARDVTWSDKIRDTDLPGSPCESVRNCSTWFGGSWDLPMITVPGMSQWHWQHPGDLKLSTRWGPCNESIERCRACCSAPVKANVFAAFQRTCADSDTCESWPMRTSVQPVPKSWNDWDGKLVNYEVIASRLVQNYNISKWN